ncbi:medium-chain dehydrogenase/reductase like protein [Neolentinus lepideus HHB14362 ss-1]|uniref:Medium-chain dehydrogenase/reductase like protein n=1 Tax=Neolentinus lepideus HHB14362 ss-1 TaxID=1314782 RepID=A0A165ND75_9AGAM|nr:medium-chain dehydrogenase/reductase like protein [Neolentinus lepideus HHB14362 ss-1]
MYPKQRQSVKSRPTPEPLPGQVQVKVHATAVNPVDYKIFDYGKFVREVPTVLGTDAAGEVTRLGSNVTNFRVGDRIIFQGQYNCQGDTSNGDKATFQQYCLADADLACKIPSSLDYDEASTIPVGAVTAAAALYDLCLGLTVPWAEGGEGLYKGQTLVVLGGSSSVGSYSASILNLSSISALSFKVVTTSSPAHIVYLKSIGASVVVDRSSPTLVGDLKAVVGGEVEYLVDAISLPDTLRAGIELVKEGGSMARVLPTNEQIEALAGEKGVRVLGAHGASHMYPEFKGFWKATGGYIERGVIKPNRPRVLAGGLRAWEEAYELHRGGKVSGEKIVLKPQETSD